MRKNTPERTNNLLLFSLMLVLHFPLLSAQHAPGTQTVLSVNTLIASSEPLLHLSENQIVAKNTGILYESMNLGKLGLAKETFDYAIKGFNRLLEEGRFKNEHIISIVDFSMSSCSKRLFVIDLKQAKVLFNTYVAHGVNSGTDMAREFSNIPESLKSSLGFYETLQTYSGKHGYSLKLEGLEKNINDNACSRAIVIHAAGYVNENFIKTRGYIGRSWGCPALPEKLHKPIINKIKDGTCLFIYSPDKNYLSQSKIINT